MENTERNASSAPSKLEVMGQMGKDLVDNPVADFVRGMGRGYACEQLNSSFNLLGKESSNKHIGPPFQGSVIKCIGEAGGFCTGVLQDLICLTAVIGYGTNIADFGISSFYENDSPLRNPIMLTLGGLGLAKIASNTISLGTYGVKKWYDSAKERVSKASSKSV